MNRDKRARANVRPEGFRPEVITPSFLYVMSGFLPTHLVFFSTGSGTKLKKIGNTVGFHCFEQYRWKKNSGTSK